MLFACLIVTCMGFNDGYTAGISMKASEKHANFEQPIELHSWITEYCSQSETKDCK